eukprot:TRINITY_DN456_c0_g1_i1.p1 TRINITY_DN456_c0_g1~~TRINITY_DN456_c0_g1_i1.p1  ORF type:complete len:397 (-),score=154.99 TRINITY_DN456_c0_g1_i1:632-1822(-)
MALRARATTVSDMDNLTGTENPNLIGKRYQAPNQQKTARAALGDVRNKQTRSVSLSDNNKLKEAQKPGIQKPKRVPAALKENEVQKVVKNDVEQMETSKLEADQMEQEQIIDIDKDDADNPQLVVEYVMDIYKYLRFLEKEQNIKTDYLAGQQVILPKMRTVLVDWLIGVQVQFKLLPETVYTAVAILDRYLMNHVGDVSRNTLQLVGVTAMLIASKYEEIYAPEVKDFVYITDKAYSDKQILDMELRVIKALKFDLGRPLPLHFLRRASKAGEVEAVTHTLAKYIMELSLTDYSLVAEPPSRLAASSLALAVRILDPGLTSMKEVWTPSLKYYTMYELKDLESTMVKLANVLLAAPSSKHTTVFIKYSNRKFLKIARIPALDDPVVKEIAAGNIK